MNLPVLTISLLKQGAEVNAKDKYGNTPLHKTAWCNTHEVVEVLLNWGAEVNAKNNRGSTPLGVAVGLNTRETAEVLRRYGGQS